MTNHPNRSKKMPDQKTEPEAFYRWDADQSLAAQEELCRSDERRRKRLGLPSLYTNLGKFED